MAALVVDASVALAWALPDESSAYADNALAALESRPLRVPELWPLEVANGLAIAIRRGRMTVEQERLFLVEMSRLTIEIQMADPLTVIRDGTAAAARFGLTALMMLLMFTLPCEKVCSLRRWIKLCVKQP